MKLVLPFAVVVTYAMSSSSVGAITLGTDFAGSYTVTDLGSPPGVPGLLGGLTLLPGSSNTLLIGGNANTSAGRLYTIGVTRDASGSINGFSGSGLAFGDVGEFNDGGVTFGPGGVLFTARWPSNELGQTAPGQTDESRVDSLAGLGVGNESISAISFVPAGFAGEGKAKIVTYIAGEFHDLALTADGAGTFDLAATRIDLDPSTADIDDLPGGPEGFVYVKGANAGFGVDSMLVAEYAAGKIGAYAIDSDGNPILSSRRDFITDLTGAEGAFIDPLTGDFLFSTFGGGDRVIRVSGFIAPPPTDPPVAPVPLPPALLMLASAAVALMGLRRGR